MPKVLITGVAGFLGRAFAAEFAEESWSVSGIDTATPENAPRPFLDYYQQAILPDTALEDAIKTVAPELIIHCAGRASVPQSFESPHLDFAAGPVVTLHLLNTLRDLGWQQKVIFCSSAAVYGNPEHLPVTENAPCRPISPYGFNKAYVSCSVNSTLAVLTFPRRALRIFSAYGPGLRRQVVYDTCLSGLRNKIVLYGSGSESRDFIHCRDVARAATVIADRGPPGHHIYNVGSGEEINDRHDCRNSSS